MKLPPKQRQYLHTELKLRFLWHNIATINQNERDAASRMATTALDGVESVATSGTTVKVAVANIMKNMEDIP